MALTTCKDCNNKFSTDASRCPNCGARKPNSLGRTLVITFSVIFLIGVYSIVHKSSPTNPAKISCQDVDSSNPDYQKNMDRVAALANLPNAYLNRYHEDIIYALCQGGADSASTIDKIINSGDVSTKEAVSIAEVLGKERHVKPQTADGKTYERVNQGLSSLGLCSACASSIASEYVKNPDNDMARLADAALAGDKLALNKLEAINNQTTPQPDQPNTPVLQEFPIYDPNAQCNDYVAKENYGDLRVGMNAARKKYALDYCIQSEQSGYNNSQVIWGTITEQQKQDCMARLKKATPWNYTVLYTCLSAYYKFDRPTAQFHY